MLSEQFLTGRHQQKKLPPYNQTLPDDETYKIKTSRKKNNATSKNSLMK